MRTQWTPKMYDDFVERIKLGLLNEIMREVKRDPAFRERIRLMLFEQ